MTRASHESDRDFRADADAFERREAAELTARSPLLEPYDDAARARFGRIISLMVTKRKRRGRDI